MIFYTKEQEVFFYINLCFQLYFEALHKLMNKQLKHTQELFRKCNRTVIFKNMILNS